MYEDIAISTRVRFARNVEGMPFPSRLNAGDERIYGVLMSGVQKALDGCGLKSKFYKMGALTDVDRNVLIEKHLISRDLAANSETGAVAISDDETISVMINEEDHIRAQCMLKGLALKEAYERLNALDDRLSADMRFAFDAKLGYLTSCPTNLGTAMRASVMLFLPALQLTGSLNSIISVAQKAGIIARGVYGEGSAAEGYMYQISNQISLGLSDAEILERVKNVVLRLCEAEKLAREQMFKQSGDDLRDKIMRSYGILKNAYKMSSAECLELIAYVKLGIAPGIIKDVTVERLNELIEKTGAATLCKYVKKQLDARDRDIARAYFVRNYLGNA